MGSHPRGLYMLSTVEMWERFSYYGMRAILSLFMVSTLMFTLPFASQVYGIYTAFIYLTPLLGGYVSDRYLGNRKSIIFGGIVMALGQFTLAYCASLYDPNVVIATHSGLIWSTQEIIFLIGLLLLCLGCGFFKANISSMISLLYEKNDDRLDSAFSIFYVGINMGSLLAPLIIGIFCSSAHPEFYKYGFLTAGIGVCIGLVIFIVLKNKYLKDVNGRDIGKRPISKEEHSLVDDELLDEAILRKFDNNEEIRIKEKEKLSKLSIDEKKKILDGPLTKVEKHRIYVIFIITFFAIFFWSAYEQAGVSLTFFTDVFISRSVGGFLVPTEWFQSVNPFFIVLLAPVFSVMWTKLNEKNLTLSTPVKMSIGLLVLAIGFIIFAIPASSINSGASSISMMWIILLYFILTIAELFISPVGLATISRLSPLRFTSLFIGVWFASSAVSNFLAGLLSSLYPDPSLPTPYLLGIIPINGFFDFFILFAVIALSGSIIVFLLRNKVNKLTHGIDK